MYEYVVNSIGTYLCWYNAGGVWVDVHQFREYLNSRVETWANSKVKN